MFGFDLHWWEHAMLYSLGATALAAIAVGVATTVVVMLTRQENRDKSEELAKYQSDADVKIAEARRGAAEANENTERERSARLALEAKVAWRRLSAQQSTALTAALAGRAFAMHFDFSQSDPEAAQFAEDLHTSLVRTNGITVHPHALVYPPAPLGVIVSGRQSPARLELESALKSAAVEFSVAETEAPDPRLSVGSKRSPF